MAGPQGNDSSSGKKGKSGVPILGAVGSLISLLVLNVTAGLVSNVVAAYGIRISVELAIILLLVLLLRKTNTLKTLQGLVTISMVALAAGGFLFKDSLSPKPSPSVKFLLQADAGWQDTGFLVKSVPSEIEISVGGRVHLAINQEYHLAELAKSLIVTAGVDHQWKKSIKNQYPAPKMSLENRFNLAWVGPSGDPSQSDILQGSKLLPTRNWGTVACAVKDNPGPTIEREDPWSIITDAEEIKSYAPDATSNSFVRSGHLLCIINDAVISRLSPYDTAKEYFEILTSPAVKDTLLDTHHQLPSSEIPLIFLNDNTGQFMLTIREK